jgi:YbbR domain-containing protein
MQPETITVAADSELLAGLTDLMIQPVSVDGMSQSFTVRAAIAPLSGVKNLSSEQVYVNVNISEASIGGRIDDVSVLVSGKGEGLSVEYNTMSVYVTGPRSVVEQLQKDGVFVSVDLTGLKAGTYEIEPVFDNERFPNITFQPEHEKMMVTLTEVGSDE